MRFKTGFWIIVFLALVVVPCSLYAQGSEIKPPVCCPPEDPPPPPPPPEGGGDSMPDPEASVALYTISDAELALLGLTRSGYLELLAETYFGLDTGYSLIIPIYSQTTAEDGSTAVSVSYFMTEAEKVDPEVLSTMSLVFVTDGQISVAVLFTAN